jgi:hypothetical protein
MVDIFSSFGLSAASGLNAYLPLLIVALMGRYTNVITLKAPFDVLENGWVILVLCVLLAIEIAADKIPAVDSVNDAIQTFVRPVSGAVLFASSNNAISDMSPVLAMALGLLMAGSVHTVKATARPIVTTTTAGVGNPFVSTAEDIISGGMTLTALLLPVIMAIVMVVLIVGMVWFLVRWRRRRTPVAA